MAFKVDGTFTAAAVHGGPRYMLPFERDTTAYIIEQDYMILLANWSRLALNTAHPSVITALLVKESDLENLGAGLVRWTRMFATLPATRSEYESYAYTFPAFIWVTVNQSNREPLTRTVTARLQYDYFLVQAGSAIDNPSDIPILARQRYYITSWGIYYDTVPPQVSGSTTPTRADYEAMVNSESEIIAEDSTVRPWIGNIYERVTRFVKAQ